MLQDARLPLHLRAHPARGAPAHDEWTVCVCPPPKLQRRRARRGGHAPRTLWPRLLVGADRLVWHARGAGVCAWLVRNGGVCTLEHLVSRADGGRASKEAIWSRVGCVGGEGAIQGDPRRVLMSIYANCHIISYHVILCHEGKTCLDKTDHSTKNLKLKEVRCESRGGKLEYQMRTDV
jgi:hypothetical protein